MECLFLLLINILLLPINILLSLLLIVIVVVRPMIACRKSSVS